MNKTIDIRGVIVPDDDLWIYDWLEISATAPTTVRMALQEANGEPVEVLINSNGGDVFAGSEIFTLLRAYSGKVLIKIQSFAASAAAVIAMAGESEMSPIAQLMIHNVSGSARGDHRNMEHAAEVLANANRAIATAFTAKTGKSEEDILALMAKETWLTAEQAVKEGFVDRVMFAEGLKVSTDPVQLAASHGCGLLSNNTLSKMRQHFNRNSAKAKAAAQYDYLTLQEVK
ncbi:MAG: Clp protease ClpP [Oscillospiraceae bacterium]|nr:Clp protease ClpP [Oscillospiraceae bacterium]MBR2422022.1 Clp protease ClpP [Oscillospiraceae bacterium]